MTKEELREWRERFDLGQDDIAKKFGVTRNTIQNWEHGATSLPAVLDDLCKVWEERLEKEMPELGPVVLCYSDGPMFISPYGPRRKLAMLQHKSFPTNAAAIARVRMLWNQPDFHGPFILEQSGKSLWNQVELARVVNGDDKGAPTPRNALAKIATYVMENHTVFARGPKVLAPDEVKKRTSNIEAIGKEIMRLAEECEKRTVEYREFEERLERLHKLGFFPPERQVGNVAHTIKGEEIARAVYATAGA